MFTEPLPPLCEIVDGYGLAHRGEWLAPGEFDFDRWHFERGCAALAERYDLDPDNALALYTLVKLYDQMSLLLIDAADADEPLRDAFAAAAEGAETARGRRVRRSGRCARGRDLPTRCWLSSCWLDGRHRPRRGGRAGHLRRGARAEGAAHGAGGVSLAARGGAGTDRRHRRGRTRAAGGRVDGYGLAAAVARPGPHRLRSRRRRARVGVAASCRRRAGPPACGATRAVPGRAAPRPRPQRAVLVRVWPQVQEMPSRRARSCHWPSGWAGCT